MPSRSFTSGRKFSTTTSACPTIRRKAASPCGAFRLSVMPRLLRCRFWKSEPWRGPPSASPASGSGGCSILMTFAPQSANCRTQVGPERTRVRSSTVKRARAWLARGKGIEDVSRWQILRCLLGRRKPTFPDIPAVVHIRRTRRLRRSDGRLRIRFVDGIQRRCLEKTASTCHMNGCWMIRPELQVAAGRVTNSRKRFSACSSTFSPISTAQITRGVPTPRYVPGRTCVPGRVAC